MSSSHAKGGYARSRRLTPRQRTVIAQKAATARWNHVPALDPSRLRTVIVHHGSPAAGFFPGVDIEDSITKAISASPYNAVLTRMLPVFLWRMRETLDQDLTFDKTTDHKRLRFFVCLLRELSNQPLLPDLLAKLDSSVAPSKLTESEPFFEASRFLRSRYDELIEEQNTPAVARQCGYLMNMPMKSFTSYFSKICAP
jgi:hypothetical protein